MNRTISGYPCQRWSLTVPHDHQFTKTGDHNFCRNPVDSGVDQLWCYANTTKLEWEYCLLPFCFSSEDIIGCQHKRTKGRDYRGKANTTVTGTACQAWSATTPHKHSFKDLGDHNYCRNPSGSQTQQLWCHTTDANIEWEYSSVPFCTPLKLLDFSLDGDCSPDEEGSYSHAFVWKENFPASFTICAAFMVERWERSINSPMFRIVDQKRKTWLYLELLAAYDQTIFKIKFSDEHFTVTSNSLFFPLRWTRLCFSFDSNNNMAALVIDGSQLGERLITVGDPRPTNLGLIIGWGDRTQESPGKFTDVNIFSNPLSNLSEAGEQCGALGDFLNWNEAIWTLQSRARLVEEDSALGPCRRESKIHVYPMTEAHVLSDCMWHCEKMGGRSPSVRTFKQWQNFAEEVQEIVGLSGKLWLPATEGDKNSNLSRPDHWPQGVEAEEGVWRDFYTGRQLDNYTKPWFIGDQGRTENCIFYYPQRSTAASWKEWQCFARDHVGCPCSYDTPPLLYLRGFCSSTRMNVKSSSFTPKQVPTNPTEVVMVGQHYSKMFYNSTQKQWIISHVFDGVLARTDASHNSNALGKQNWTITNDAEACSKGQASYTIEMKLSACKEDEFTCNNGQCVNMKKRCNQLSNCRDKSDELNCQILILEEGYNKRVPPISPASLIEDLVEPVRVKTSLSLLKVVAIEEEDHAIQLQFEIALEWKEKRATYHNLKGESYLNALSVEDINRLWLPLVVYTNTAQQETTRLGVEWEWITKVLVKREADFQRSDPSVLDEAEIFKGEENSLFLVQSFTLP